MYRLRLGLTVFAFSALAASSAPALRAAAGAGEATTEVVAWHVVRTGDTLEDLTVRYLGDRRRWPENWKLNPQVADPHKLTPGERLRIKLAQRPAEPDALLRSKSQTVADKLGPRSWDDATENDLLLDRDGLRTGRSSSAELAFNDGARLLITEDSLVFLRQQGQVLKVQTPRGIEIQEGAADIQGGAAPSALPDVEIILGKARATSKLTGGDAQSRARRAASGESAFMVYRGEGLVEAGGAKIEVPQGTGSALPPNGPPSKPETLLAAPVIVEPRSGAAFSCGSPPLRWTALAGAATYSVEICRDSSCAALVDRTTGLEATEWHPSPLPPGDYFLRLTARSASGLDGYSASAAFRVIEGGGASTPAAAAWAITATGISGQRGDTLWIDNRSQLTIVGANAVPLAGFAPQLDGKPVALAAWKGPWAAGPHTASAAAPGPCGEPLALATVRFAVDSEGPQAQWATVNLPASPEQAAAKDAEQHRRFPPPVRWPQPAQLEWSLDGIAWVPFTWGVPQPWQRGPRLPPATWYSTLDNPENPGRLPEPVDEAVLYLRAPQANPFKPAAPVKLSGWTALAVKIRDTESGVSRLWPHPHEISKGNWVLRIETADLVGNRKVLDWPIVPRSEK